MSSPLLHRLCSPLQYKHVIVFKRLPCLSYTVLSDLILMSFNFCCVIFNLLYYLQSFLFSFLHEIYYLIFKKVKGTIDCMKMGAQLHI